jgi:type VI secretion system protein ImpH
VAAPERTADLDLTVVEAIEDARCRGFYPLVQLLERLAGGPPAGTAGTPGEERIRFRHDPALGFSTGDVAGVRVVRLPPEPADPAGVPRRGFEVVTTFLGLTGAVSPLPSYLVEEVAQEDPDAPRLREFLDLFHHRLLAFLYRARARCDVPAGWRSDLADAWSPRLLALLGVDAATGGAEGRFPAWRLLRLAPLLAERNLTAHALAVGLADMLGPDLDGAEVTVEPFAGAWVPIAESQLARLGRTSSRLGQDLVVGRRIFDAGGRFRVVFGPLSARAYRRFAEGDPVRRAEEMIEALVSEPLEHEIVLWLSEDAAPALRLGSSRVGKDTWLGGQRKQKRIRVDRAA